MIRIPNPVSNVDVFIRVFLDIYPQLMGRDDFQIDDISSAMIDTHNVTSQGAIGIEALNRSTRHDRTRDPIYNQSKMYVELFRTLGWIHSTSSGLINTVTLLGDHVAQALNPKTLMKECLLGIAYPNEVLAVTDSQKIRVMGVILQSMKALDFITRDEMMAGPMSIDNDTVSQSRNTMFETLRRCRRQPGELNNLLEAIATRDRIKVNPTMQNYTRIPIAAIVWAGWGVKENRTDIRATQEGIDFAERYSNSNDLRVNNFLALPDTIKPDFIRFCHYQMLERSGFDTSSIASYFAQLRMTLQSSGLFSSLEFTFSPFQQLSRATLMQWTPDLINRQTSIGQASDELPASHASIGYRSEPVRINCEILPFPVPKQEEGSIAEIIKHELDSGIDGDIIIERIMADYRLMKKEEFYPAVADLLTIIGYDCLVSRAGQNYSRADAIITIADESIPIEIKSPTEEIEISLKAIRQALENKIIFLSRQFYSTSKASNSLVVGYKIPNQRAEVFELIEDIYTTYGIKIGVLDVSSLLKAVVITLSLGKQVYFKNLHLIKGVIIVADTVAT